MAHKKTVKFSDPDFEQTVLKWYNEAEEADDDIGSELEDNVEVLSDNESVISLADISDESDIDNDIQDSDTVTGKSGFRWSTKEPPKTKTAARNIVLKVPGARGNARNISSELEAWKVLFTDNMIDEIVTYTNQEIDIKKDSYGEARYVEHTDSVEILALIGLLYISGARKDAHLPTCEMFSKQSAKIYRCILSEPRFKFLINCLRFDDKTLRNRDDKFAPIRELWDSFITLCTESYIPHAYCTIDEQLLGFRGNCPFRVYIASKPDKYGLKIVTMCDSRTFYMISAIPYIGKETRVSQEPLASQLVKTLTVSIHGTNRNVTMDNWFTSIPLAEDMLKNYKLTITGTLRHNKREIPPSFLPNRRKDILSSQFAFHEKMTLVSFTPRKSKSVILLSTMHYSKEVNQESHKPEIIEFYNSTKGGVDTFDQMVHFYTVSRKTRRWPMRYFYGMLDQAGVNCMVLYRLATQQDKIIRRKFLAELGFQLAQPHMKRRLDKNLPKQLKQDIADILNKDGDDENQEPQEPPRKLQKHSRCHLCPRSRDRKSKIVCAKCSKAVCPDHRDNVCNSCL